MPDNSLQNPYANIIGEKSFRQLVREYAQERDNVTQALKLCQGFEFGDMPASAIRRTILDLCDVCGVSGLLQKCYIIEVLNQQHNGIRASIKYPEI